MTLAQKSDRILAQTRGLSGATPNATQLIEELRWALEENRREVEHLRAERDALLEQRDRWIAGTQLHAARANENPPEIRSHRDSADA